MKQVRQLFSFQPFSQKQRRVLNWWCSSSPVKGYDGIIADGAIRSGKTLSMSLSFVLWAMTQFDGQNFAMCGKTIGSFRRNVLFLLRQMLKSRGYAVTDHRTDNLIIVRRGEVENYFYVFGGKDERSQDLIQGITLAGVFFDEVALMPESFVNQATGRCSVAGSKYWFNCNPDGPYHWFKLGWIDRSAGFLGAAKTRQLRDAGTPVKNLLYLHFTMDDNLSLSEDIKARYRSNYTGVFFKRYILGLWTMAEGVIYDMFDPDRHTVDTAALAAAYAAKQEGVEEPESFWNEREWYVSCDYGTLNPTVFLLWNHARDGRWYILREYYYSGRTTGRQKTDAEFSADLTKWLDGQQIRRIVLDPAAASFKAQLEKDGYRVRKANNDVLDGIRFVATCLNQNSIQIDRSCVNTIAEFGSYIWDDKAAQRGEDRPVKEHDHAMDALRYQAYTVIRRPSAVQILR